MPFNLQPRPTGHWLSPRASRSLFHQTLHARSPASRTPALLVKPGPPVQEQITVPSGLHIHGDVVAGRGCIEMSCFVRFCHLCFNLVCLELICLFCGNFSYFKDSLNKRISSWRLGAVFFVCLWLLYTYYTLFQPVWVIIGIFSSLLFPLYDVDVFKYNKKNLILCDLSL